jgi:pimeloyl-ACP methyl ester carboxylesterase
MLHIERLGKDKPSTILFLHGIAGSTASWGKEFQSLASHHNVIFVDALGFGESHKPANISYSMEDHMDALSSVMEQIDTEQITVIGHSMGSILALGLVQRYPNRVGRLVLISLPLFQNENDAIDVISASSTFNRWMALENPLSRLVCAMMCKYRKRIMPLMPYFFSKLPPQVARDSLKPRFSISS